MTDYYRVTTQDLRPPVRGGDPTPHPGRLPRVDLDTSERACAPGWHVSLTPENALQLSGLWPGDRPARLWRCRAVKGELIIERGRKLRAATWDVVEELEVTDEILARLHAPMAGDGLTVEEIVSEVQAWRHALSRPTRDRETVQAGLREALRVRELEWALVEYDTSQAAWAAWAGWDARDAWSARAARNAWYAWASRDAWASRASRGAWDARASSRAAWAALTVYVAARRGWTQQDPHLLTTGLRDAYAAGLGVTVPVDGELRWTMYPKQDNEQ